MKGHAKTRQESSTANPDPSGQVPTTEQNFTRILLMQNDWRPGLSGRLTATANFGRALRSKYTMLTGSPAKDRLSERNFPKVQADESDFSDRMRWIQNKLRCKADSHRALLFRYAFPRQGCPSPPCLKTKDAQLAKAPTDLLEDPRQGEGNRICLGFPKDLPTATRISAANSRRDCLYGPKPLGE